MTFCDLFAESDDIEKLKGSLPAQDQMTGFKMSPVDFEKVRPFCCFENTQ